MTNLILKPVAPDLEETLRSIHGHHNATIEIVNNTDREYRMYWIDYEGNRRRCHNDLPPRGTFRGKTYSTHPYVLADEKGAAQHILIAEAAECVAYIN